MIGYFIQKLLEDIQKQIFGFFIYIYRWQQTYFISQMKLKKQSFILLSCSIVIQVFFFLFLEFSNNIDTNFDNLIIFKSLKVHFFRKCEKYYFLFIFNSFTMLYMFLCCLNFINFILGNYFYFKLNYFKFLCFIDQYHALAVYIELNWRNGNIEQAEKYLKNALSANPRSTVHAGFNYCKGLYEWYN